MLFASQPSDLVLNAGEQQAYFRFMQQLRDTLPQELCDFGQGKHHLDGA